MSDTIEDGFGGCWSKCSRPAGCDLEVVRPGKVQCSCETEGLIYVHNTEAGISGWLDEDTVREVIEKQAQIIRELKHTTPTPDTGREQETTPQTRDGKDGEG